MSLIFSDVNIEIVKRRWEVEITITQRKAPCATFVYIASADSFYVEGSGVYFDTKEAKDQLYEERNGR